MKEIEKYLCTDEKMGFNIVIIKEMHFKVWAMLFL